MPLRVENWEAFNLSMVFNWREKTSHDHAIQSAGCSGQCILTGRHCHSPPQCLPERAALPAGDNSSCHSFGLGAKIQSCLLLISPQVWHRSYLLSHQQPKEKNTQKICDTYHAGETHPGIPHSAFLKATPLPASEMVPEKFFLPFV